MAFYFFRDAMKLQPLGILPFAAAIVAVVVAAIFHSIETLAVALPSVLLGVAVLYLYSKPPEVAPKGIQLENFSIWADIGEPGAELRRLEPNDIWSAVRVMKADLNTLSANAALLDKRILMLIGRENFDGLARYDLQGDARKVARKTADIGNKMEVDGKFPSETIPTLEQSAALLDRAANKLFEFERGKPETVHIYVDPLKRAAEKLSRDMRQATSNITSFSKGAEKGAPAPEKSAPAAPQASSPEQPPKSSEQGTSGSGQGAPGTSG
jgi:hypothetical protein